MEGFYTLTNTAWEKSALFMAQAIQLFLSAEENFTMNQTYHGKWTATPPPSHGKNAYLSRWAAKIKKPAREGGVFLLSERVLSVVGDWNSSQNPDCRAADFTE